MYVLYFPQKSPKRRRENTRQQEYLVMMLIRLLTRVFKKRLKFLSIRRTRHNELLYILSHFIFLPSIAMVTCLAPFYLATDAVTKYHELMDINTEKNNARMCEQVRSTQLGKWSPNNMFGAIPFEILRVGSKYSRITRHNIVLNTIQGNGYNNFFLVPN